jgi:hypothetical protein
MTNLSRHAFAHSLARGAAPHAHWPELTEQTRQAVDDYRMATGKKQANFNGA